MNLLYKKLGKSSRGQTLLYVLVSIVNIVIIGVFSKLIIEINKIKETAAVVSKDEELLMYFSMLIAVSIVIILFSLWIMKIVCQTIFESRKDFNIQIRLLGVSQEELTKMYIKEFLRYQALVIPVGILLIETVYYVLSKLLEISSNWIGIVNLFVAILIHLFVMFICIGITFKRITKFDPLEEMRSPYKTYKIRQLTRMDFLTGIVGVILLLIGIFVKSNNQIFTFFPIIGVFLLFDLIMVSIQYVLNFISKVFKLSMLRIGQQNLLGYYKRINPILTTLTVGVMICFGLLGMFETIRYISKDTVEQNIYFEKLIVDSDVVETWTQAQYEKFVKNIDPHTKLAYGINMEMQDSDNITNTIYAIDGDYLKYGEKMTLVNGEDPTSNLNNPDFDGIYLPDYFITDEDIGKTYSLSINGNKVEFKIEGRFVANGSRGRYGFVSKSYFQSVMGNKMVNALYIKEGSNNLIAALTDNRNVISNYIISKDDIANNSYDNAINGVEIFEIAAYMIILISFLMFIHYSLATSKQNVFDITRLRAMGINKRNVRISYCYQAVCIFSLAFALGGVLAYMFINVGVRMSLEFIDVPVLVHFPWSTLFIIYVLLLILSTAVVYFTTRKAFNKNLITNLVLPE